MYLQVVDLRGDSEGKVNIFLLNSLSPKYCKLIVNNAKVHISRNYLYKSCRTVNLAAEDI